MRWPGLVVGLTALLVAPAAAAEDGLAALMQKEVEALAPLEKITERILLSEQEADNASRDMSQLEHQIAEADRRLGALDTRAEERSTLLRSRVRQMYKASRGGFFRLAFNAREGEDLFALLSSAAMVLRRDVRELKLYQREQARHREERRRLEAQRQRKALASQRLQRVRAELQTTREQLNRRISILRDDRRKRMQLRRNLNATEQALLKRIVALQVRRDEAGGFAAQKGSLRRPVSGPVVARFGSQKDSASGLELRHQGLTYRPSREAKVRSVAAGVVRQAGPLDGYGNLVIVEHPGGFFSIYGYMARIAVAAGETVQPGHELGSAGIAPMSGDRALYFELRHGRHALNPADWLR